MALAAGQNGVTQWESPSSEGTVTTHPGRGRHGPWSCPGRLKGGRPVAQGTGATEWWELGTGDWGREACAVAWPFRKGIVLLLLTKPQLMCRVWLGTCHCPW